MEYDIFQELLESLNSSDFSPTFHKSSSSHDKGDFRCYLQAIEGKDESTVELFSQRINNLPHWARELVKFDRTSDGVGLFLCRTKTFSSCLKNVTLLGPSYGSNTLFKDQVICIEADVVGRKNLTTLRIKYVSKVLSACLTLCGPGEIRNSFENIHESSKATQPRTISDAEKEEGNISSVKHPLVIKITSKPISKSCYVVLVGNVLGSNGKMSTMECDQYFRLRKEEIQEMTERKAEYQATEAQGENINMEEPLLDTIITFDLLHTTICRPVTLSLEAEPSRRTSSKGAVFILYNYVRLSALCDKFDSLVLSGDVPSLPPSEQIDFSLLSGEDEWKLMFDYILYWPQIVKKSVSDLKCGKPKLHSLISFLSALASDFSQYYRKTRILTEPRAHLLPILYARIHLLRALKVVYKNALSVLSIRPPSKM